MRLGLGTAGAAAGDSLTAAVPEPISSSAELEEIGKAETIPNRNAKNKTDLPSQNGGLMKEPNKSLAAIMHLQRE
ncbi:MAG: hypothetical protein DWI25_08955 [Planctomycetota bacterium]|nr:MAG: hypothetical protein DWI25_08955 [Planctomycetota bacterium]